MNSLVKVLQGAAVLSTPALAIETTGEAQGGKPFASRKASVKDFDYQPRYQQALGVGLSSMPLISNYGFHRVAAAVGAEAKAPSAMFRFYGPTGSFCEGSFKLLDIIPVH